MLALAHRPWQRSAGRMRVIKWLFAIFALIFVPQSATSAEPQMLRFGTFLPAPTINVRFVFKPWVEDVNRALEGEVEIELFAGGSMGRNGTAQLKLLISNVLDITMLIPHYTPGQFPDAELFEIPVFDANALEVSLVFWRMYERGLLTGFDDIHPLALFVATPSYLHLDFPYRTADDLKGRKIRVTTLLQANVIEELGGTAVGGITATQIAESLSRGLLDGAIFNWYAARRPLGITQVTSHHVERPVAFTPGIIGMNKARYDSLSPIARARLDGLSGERLIRRLIATMVKYAEQSRAASRADDGRVFVTASESEKARWDRAFEHQLDAWRAKTARGEALLEAYAQILAEIRAGEPAP